MDTLTYIGYIAGLFLVSLAVGGISGPVIVKVLEFFSGKTKSTLDDRIISAIKVPLESCFFIIVFYLLLHAVPELSDAAKFLENYTSCHTHSDRHLHALRGVRRIHTLVL